MNKLCVAVVVASAFGGQAHAQGLVELSTDWVWPESVRKSDPEPQLVRGLASSRERDFGSSVAAALGAEAGPVARIGHFFTNPNVSTPSILSARGVRVALDGGTVVERFHLDSEQHAFDYALYGVNLGDANSAGLVEARGKQVVVIRGPGLDDPDRASRAFDAAWGGGLPTPEGRPSVTASMLPGANMIITTRRPDPTFDREFEESRDAIRAQADERRPGFSQTGDGRYTFELESGVNGELIHANGVRAVVIAGAPEKRDGANGHLARALATGTARAPTASKLPVADAADGAAKALSNLFD